MKTIINFNLNEQHGTSQYYEPVPRPLAAHTCEALENYLLYGLSPGGFIEAMLANDIHRAAYIADSSNRQCLWSITMWITLNAPQLAKGSYANVQDWCQNVDNRRQKWAKPIIENHTLTILKTP